MGSTCCWVPNGQAAGAGHGSPPRGHLGELTGQVPAVEGVDLLSMARGESTPGWELRAEQLKSVLLSAMRSHEITVVDLPRALGAAAWEALRRAQLAVLLVRDDVRGIAAGREVVHELGGECDRFGLVVRQRRSRLLDPSLVATGVGLPLLGCFADDVGLVLAAERGDPPGRSARSCWPGSVGSCLAGSRRHIRPKRKRWRAHDRHREAAVAGSPDLDDGALDLVRERLGTGPPLYAG